MGTSASYRAPAVPRWQAFVTALQAGLPIGRTLSELFNAGSEWQSELASPSVASFAVAVHEALMTVSRAPADVETVVRDLVVAAKAGSHEAGASSADAVAERAFVALLTRTATAQAAPDVGTATPANPTAEYVGELISQYTAHVTSREAGRLTEGPDRLTVRQTRSLTRELANAARQIARDAVASGLSTGDISGTWSSLIDAVFERGRQLPGRSV